ncbi:hypothetical protein QL285_020411 [Trifolium repens]|nr:hypothetical protein QL285_020411 [Trifolium repens]
MNGNNGYNINTSEPFFSGQNQFIPLRQINSGDMAIPILNNSINGLIMAGQRPQNDLSIAINSNPMVIRNVHDHLNGSIGNNLELMEINDGNDVGSAGERKRRRNQLPRDDDEGCTKS